MIRLRRFWPPRPLATIRKNTHGTIVPGLLQPLVLGVLRLQQRPQIVRHREHAAFAVLRRVRVEPDLAGVEVDLPPFERQHLGLEMRQPVMYGELDHRAERRRQVA